MKIHIPTPLRVYTDKQDTVGVEASTVGEALDVLTSRHPDLRKHLYSDEGKLRAFVNVYLNDEDIRYLPEREATRVNGKDELSIIPSIAGGTGRTGGRASRIAKLKLSGPIAGRERNLGRS